MVSQVFQDPPVIVGHRGLGNGTINGHAENTVASLLAAAEIARWVEIDVRRTADDVLVLGHQPALHNGTPIAEASAETAIAAGHPAVDEVLGLLPNGIGVVLDLKSALEDAVRPPERTTAALVVPLAVKTAANRPLLVTSFDPAALDLLARTAPQVARGLITWLWFPVGIAVAAAARSDVQVLSVHHGSLQPNSIEPEPQHPGAVRVVEVAHAASLEVLAWCPDVDQAQVLLDAGVDAICVNELPVAAVALSVSRGARHDRPYS
jgi:glycerophosphoryl diester phosphodiesterase